MHSQQESETQLLFKSVCGRGGGMIVERLSNLAPQVIPSVVSNVTDVSCRYRGITLSIEKFFT